MRSPSSPLGLVVRAGAGLLVAAALSASAHPASPIGPLPQIGSHTQGKSTAPARATPLEFGVELSLSAELGVEQDIAGLVTRWADQSARRNDPAQPAGSRLPVWRPFAMNGLPALEFDGNDRMSTPTGMPFGDYTKVAVVRLRELGDRQDVLSGNGYHALWFDATGHAQLENGSAIASSSTPVTVDQPVVLIGTYDVDTGDAELYQDGVLVGSGNGSANPDPAIEVGGLGAANFLRGWISELRIYDHVLDPAELATLSADLVAKYVAPSFPDVEFTTLPRNAQLFPRDLSDQHQLTVDGTVHTPGWSSVEVVVLQDGAGFTTVSQPLSYTGSDAPFSLSPVIDAGLFDYDLRVELVAGPTRVRVAERSNLLCGDVILVNGQSNAVATDYHEEHLANQSQSFFIRTFGTSLPDGPEVPFDLNWAMADGENQFAHASVGAWPLRVAEILVQDQEVPIALINGALGGTNVFLHQRNDLDPTDLDTIYGRLLYRVQEAEVLDDIRILLWHQGESDGAFAGIYTFFFDELHTDLFTDYPSLQTMYMFQIRQGCNTPNNPVREAIRTRQDVYPDIYVMSTEAAPGHDGCHFEYAGYREFGDRMARVVLRDFYGSSDTLGIDPPNIDFAFWTTGIHDKLLLVFRNPTDTLVLDPNAYLDFAVNDPSVSILSATISANTISLQLSGASTATTVSYKGHFMDGDWLKNARGVGALSFFDVPIL